MAPKKGRQRPLERAADRAATESEKSEETSADRVDISSSAASSTDRLTPASDLELNKKMSYDGIQVDDCVAIAATTSSDANCNAKEVKSQVVESAKEAASDGQNDVDAQSERKVASPSTPRKEAEETSPTKSAPIGGRETSSTDSHPNITVDIQAQANTCEVKIQLSKKAALGIALGDNKASGMPVLKEVKPSSPLRGKIPAEFVGSSVIQAVAIQGRRLYPQLATECVRMIQEAQVLPPHRGWPLTIEMSLKRKDAAVPDELRDGKRIADTEASEKRVPTDSRGRGVARERKQTSDSEAIAMMKVLSFESAVSIESPQCDTGAKPAEFHHAINYVTAIKKRFASHPEIYHGFLEILHAYQKEPRIKKMLDEVSLLFADHADLLKDFVYFLPDAVQGQAKAQLDVAAKKAKEQDRQARLVTSEVKRTAIPGAVEEAWSSPSKKHCPKCGANFNSRGYYNHVNACRGRQRRVEGIVSHSGSRDDSYHKWGGGAAPMNQAPAHGEPRQRESRVRQKPKRFKDTALDSEVGRLSKPDKSRLKMCGECDACVRDDCGKCENCLDKPRFGGKGKRRQKCVLRTCLHAPQCKSPVCKAYAQTGREGFCAVHHAMERKLGRRPPLKGEMMDDRRGAEAQQGPTQVEPRIRRKSESPNVAPAVGGKPWWASLKGRGCIAAGCTRYKKARAGGYCLGCYKDRNERRSPEDAYLSVTNDAEAALESSFEQMLDQAILQSEKESTYLDFKNDPRYKSIMYAKFKEMGRGTNVDESVVDEVLQRLKKRGGRIFKRGVPQRRAQHRKVVKAEYEEADDTAVTKAISGHLRNRNQSYQKWGDGSAINLVTPQRNSTLANPLEVSRSKRKRQKPQNFMEAQSQDMLVREELVKQRRETGVRGIKPFSVNENRAFEQGCIAHGWGNWVLVVKEFLPQRTTKECRTHAAMITERHPEIRERLMEEYNGTWANYNRATTSPKKKAKRTTDGAAQCTKTNARKGHGAAEVVAKRSPSNLTKQCPKCGEDFHSQGYHNHVNACGRRREPEDVTPPRAIQSQPGADGKIAMTCPHCSEVKRFSPKTAAASYSNHTKVCAQKKKEASETYRASNSAGKPPSSTSRERLQSIPIFKQRMRIRKGMRLKVRFVDKRGGVKWYPGAIDKVLSRGRKIKVCYDDGTEETAGFPDGDIFVEGLQGTSTRRSKRKCGVSKPSVIKLPNKKKATRVDVHFAKGRRGKANAGCRLHKGRHQTIPSAPDFYAVETLPERLALAKAEPCENLGVGWTVKVVPRKDVADGATKHDKYYFSPEGKRFRTMAEAVRYTKQRNRSEAIKASWKRRKKELAAKEQARDARRKAAKMSWAKQKGKKQQRTSRSEAMKASWKRRKRELAKKEQTREAQRQARRQAAKKGWATRKGQKQQWANEELQQMHFRQTQVGKDSESANEASRISKRKAPPDEVDSVAALRAELEQEKRKVRKLKDSLEEVRGDLDVAKETVEHQLLATDRWQGRFDELARRAESGPVNGAVIAELRSRPLASEPTHRMAEGARFRKIKVGRISGFPVVVKQGRGRHEAILVECDDDPERFIAQHSGQEVKIRWKIAGYDDFVLANDVRLLGGNTVW